jgi:hypothetical protein
MKTLKLFVVFFLASSWVQAQSVKTFDLKDFSKIQIGGAYTVTVKKGNFSIKVSGSADDVNDLRAEVTNGELSFFQKEKKFRTSRVTVEIVLPQLQAVKFSGAVKATVESGFNYDNFVVYLSGNSEATINTQSVQTYVDVTGTSSLTIRGKTTSLQANISGAANLNAYEFPTDNAKLDVVGTSGAKVYVNKSLTASAVGTAKIRYKGSVTNVISDAKGLSSVKKE